MEKKKRPNRMLDVCEACGLIGVVTLDGKILPHEDVRNKVTCHGPKEG